MRRDGIGIVYMPLVPNESKVPGFDPFIVSTWRRELAPEESQKLLDVAEVRTSCLWMSNIKRLTRFVL
jgi:phospholipase A2